MISLRKHITLILLGIFFFPILFQSVHIVWHHSHSYEYEHDICHKKTSKTNSYSKNGTLSETEETCLICEYKFSINDSPEFFFFHSIIPSIACIYKQIDKQQPYTPFFSDKSPRAPPILIS